jgi:hypothetical protein
MRNTITALLMLCGALLNGAAQANDSVAGIGAGGLEFDTSDAITMEKEALSISLSRIRVDYVFRNVTNAPVDIYVAFPLPIINMAEVLGYGGYNVPDPDSANFFAFETRVNDRPAPTSVQTKAFVNGKDITRDLRDANVAFDIPGPRLMDSLGHMSRADMRKLTAIGALGDGGCGEMVCPLWSLEKIYYRQQRFEPLTTVRISHSYKPAFSTFFVQSDKNLAGSKDARFPVNAPEYATWCMDEGLWRSVNKPRGPNAPDTFGLGHEIQYILKTANSWNGPIGDFVLTIDKGAPGNLLSLCIDGIKKTGSATFEVRKQNYRPDQDLKILFIAPEGAR